MPRAWARPPRDGAWRQCPRSRRRYEWYRPRFALGNAGYVGTGEAQHAAAQIEHRGFKRKTGAGAWLVKQSGKLFAFAAFRVGSRLTADIFAQPQKPVQLFHGKVQRVDQMAHIHSLQESLAGTAAAPACCRPRGDTPCFPACTSHSPGRHVCRAAAISWTLYRAGPGGCKGRFLF